MKGRKALFWEKLNQNRICVFLVVIVCVLAGTIYSFKFTPKEWLSSSTIMLIKTKNDTENLGGLELSSNLISTFEEVAKSELTVAEVKSNLNLDIDNKKLNKKISLDRVSSSDTFEIEVRDSDSRLALEINTEILNVFSNRIKDMYGDAEVYIVDAPHISKTIYSTPIYISLLLSALIGLIISALYILILVKKEKKVKSVVDLEIDIFLKTLAQIPLNRIDKKDKNVKSELICYDSEKSEVSKAFKTLRTNLQFLSVNNTKQNRIILVTSSVKGEGKSYVAANMAVSFAEIGKKVLLLDADMSTGRLGKMFNIPNNLGLSNYLSNLDANGVEINQFFNKFIKETAIKNLNLITSGTIPPNSSELLTSPKMTDLIKDLKVFYDIIIIDGTSSLTSTDSLILTRLVGATVIVANYKKTKKEEILKTKRDLQNVGGKIIGVVLNKVKIKKQKKTKAERKESFAKFKLNVKDKVKLVTKYIRERIVDSKQKLLTEKTTEVTDLKEDVIIEEKINEENKKSILLNSLKEKFKKSSNKNNDLNENIEEKEIETVNEENEEIDEEVDEKPYTDTPSKVLSFISETKNKFIKTFSKENIQEEQEVVLDDPKQENKIVEKQEVQEEQVKKIEENMELEKQNEEKSDFSTSFGTVKEKIVKVKDITFEKTKNLKENTINIYNKTKENCIEKYNNFIEKKNPIIEEKTESIEVVKESKEIIKEKKKESKQEIRIDNAKRDNAVSVVVDAENGCCRVFSKECFTEKLIRGIDRNDGIPKAHYSRTLLRKRLNGLMVTYGLSLTQAKRIDSLIYITLCDYDDCIWIERKLPSNKAELYVHCMATEFLREEGETDEDYIIRCQRLRKSALEKAELNIEYKLDNIWKTTKINLLDKITMKKFANLYEIEPKMKNDNEIQNLNIENRDELEKNKEEKRVKQENDRREKEFQKQERKEENIRKKREKQKQKEEQRMQKELERENKEREAKLEEDLLIDNLYPKTKHNKSL